MRKGTLFVEIDKVTPCLVDSYGKQYRTIAFKIEDQKILIGFNKKTGWYINWFSLYEKYEIYALVLADSPSVFQGLVAVENHVDMQATIIQWAVAAPHNNPKLTPFKKFYGVGGHLFAIALLASLKAGFGGVVIGHPANKILFEHYINELGAEAFNTDYFSRQYHYTIILHGMNARKIYETYTFEEIEMEME